MKTQSKVKLSKVDRLKYRLYRLGELQLHCKKVDDFYFRIMAQARKLHIERLKLINFRDTCFGVRWGIGSGYDANGDI